MTINAPEPWEHQSGYYLNADGKAIRYELDRGDQVLEAYIEAVLDEDEGEMTYRPSILDKETKEFLVYPERFTDKSRAIERFRQHMEYYV